MSGAALDVDAMREAAQGVLGVHDFKAFASPLEDRGASTVRELMAFEVQRDGATVTCELTANAFLPHQVRRMVGALADVGQRQVTPSQIRLVAGRRGVQLGRDGAAAWAVFGPCRVRVAGVSRRELTRG